MFWSKDWKSCEKRLQIITLKISNGLSIVYHHKAIEWELSKAAGGEIREIFNAIAACLFVSKSVLSHVCWARFEYFHKFYSFRSKTGPVCVGRTLSYVKQRVYSWH